MRIFVENKGLGHITSELLSCTSPFTATFFVGLGLGRAQIPIDVNYLRIEPTSSLT